MKKNVHAERLAAVRRLMAERGVDAVVMENVDPHQSEYLPAHWREVEWLTGFSGEVATLVVTAREAALWTDSRFWTSGTAELAETGVVLMRRGLEATPTEAAWMAQGGASRLGVDHRLMTRERIDSLAAATVVDIRPVETLWTARPPLPDMPVEVYPEQYDGESAASKLERVRTAMAADGVEVLRLVALDDVAWVLGLRGQDVDCTPVFVAYLDITPVAATLWLDVARLTADARAHLAALGVEVVPYAVRPQLELPSWNPVPLMRAVKNEVEIEGERRAMLHDGVALTRFYHWLESRLGSTPAPTEVECATKLIEMRRTTDDSYRSESFPAIVAWKGHAAMPHYMPTPTSDVPIEGDGLLLIDTGGQYLDGTTDVTRTIGVGTPTDEERRDYTLVLKGHIRLATAVYPRGTRGDSLDALARMDLWREGKDYGHGTGHGVGHYLCVHEGPQSIRRQSNPQPLLPGMVTSNEPAYYAEGRHGVRHENCVLTVPLAGSNAFLQFETLTLCYIDTRPVVTDLMTASEIAWLNAYNERVYQTLSPHLDEAVARWLRDKTMHI